MHHNVTTYFLEMRHRSEFKPKEGFKEKLEIKQITNDVFQHWMLFVGVGLPWRWYSRIKWSPEEWGNYFNTNDSRLYLAFSNKQLVGYFELVYAEKMEVELTFFGLFPNSIGAGYGGFLLSHVLDIVWNSGASKIWLHTCTSDHQMAISNYIARGFKVISQITEDEEVPNKTEYLKMINNFMSKYIDEHNKFHD